MHCDIKPDNIGIQPDFGVKLFDWSDAIDLNQAKVLSDKELEKQVGTPQATLFPVEKASQAFHLLVKRW